MSEPKQEIECQICGKMFIPSRAGRKYCDDCSPNSDNLKKKLNTAMKESRNRTKEENILEFTCLECSKNFKTIYKLIFPLHHRDKQKDVENGQVFCSRKCQEAYIRKHLYCKNCGIILYGHDYQTRYGLSEDYCSPECEEEYLRKTKKCVWCNKSLADVTDIRTAEFCSDECREKGWRQRTDQGWAGYYICENCKKPYHINTLSSERKSYFCSSECKKEAKAKGWKEPDKYMKIKLTCNVCKSSRFVEVKLPYNTSTYICSDECREKYKKLQKHRNEEDQRHIATILKRRQTTKTGNKNDKEHTPLCADCKISYKDCERMQSEFRIIPKGARYNKYGVLTVCPKYKNS